MSEPDCEQYRSTPIKLDCDRDEREIIFFDEDPVERFIAHLVSAIQELAPEE